jgi:hypothetical protein
VVVDGDVDEHAAIDPNQTAIHFNSENLRGPLVKAYLPQ